MIRRRHLLTFAFALVAFAFACTRSAERCEACGMKLDPASPWRAEIVGGARPRAFDTPRCALRAWDEGGRKDEVRAQEFYDRAMRPAAELRFVLGSDVVGPMGAELVPVAPEHVAKFQKDHGGAKVLAIESLEKADLR